MQKKPTGGRSCSVFSGLLLGLSVLSLSATAQAATQTLTEEEAVARGMEIPAVEDVLQRGGAIARAQAMEERLWSNPVLSYSREDTSDSAEDMALLEQELIVSGSRGLRAAAADRLVFAAKHAANRHRDLRVARIRREFYSVLVAQERVAATREWARQLEAAVDVVARREAGGDVSAYDRRRVERELRHAESRVISEEAALEQAWAHLAPLVLMAPASDGRWPTAIGTLLPSVDAPSLDDLQSALKLRPDLLALDEKASAAELTGRAAARGWVPPITLGAGPKTVDGEGARDTGFVVTASVPIPVFRREQPEAVRAEAEARYRRGRRVLERAEAEARLRALWRNVDRLTRAAQRFAKQNGDSSAQLVRSAEAAYRGGQIGILELLDAYDSRLDDELRRLELKFEARQARIDLDSTTGGDAQP